MSSNQPLTRRNAAKFIAAGATSLAISGIVHPQSSFASNGHSTDLKRLQIGLVADVHQDTIHDGFARMLFFIDQMKKRKPDILLQLGDFAVPRKRNKPFLDTWNSFDGAKYHVLGNHDMDHGFSKEETMKWWGMPSRYYSFDENGWHFVVLDGNKTGAPWVGEVDREQQDWLAEDLKKTDAPTLVWSHQSLEMNGSISTGKEVRAILEEANREAGRKKVFACLCGHHHTDYLREVNGISYIQINSMSYKYLGSGHRHKRYADHIEHANPKLELVFPYRDPLFTMLTLDPTDNTMTIEGKQTEYVPPTPVELKLARAKKSPAITARKLELKNI